jgi:hypothetical protein
VKGHSFDKLWVDEINEMPSEAVHLPVPGLLPEDIPEEPLLEPRERMPQGVQVTYIQDTLPGMEDPGDFEYGDPEDILSPRKQYEEATAFLQGNLREMLGKWQGDV